MARCLSAQPRQEITPRFVIRLGAQWGVALNQIESVTDARF